MSMTADFFTEIGRRGGTDDLPFVDGNEIAELLGMNDTDLVATIESLELGNLIEDLTRGGRTEVRLTPQGLIEWRKRAHINHFRCNALARKRLGRGQAQVDHQRVRHDGDIAAAPLDVGAPERNRRFGIGCRRFNGKKLRVADNDGGI